MDVEALSKTKGGKKGCKGKDKESETKKFDGNCFWCGAHGHAVKDCRKKAAGKPRTAQGGKRKDKGGRSKKSKGNCFWCGAYGHMLEDCHKKAVGKPQVPKSPRGADPKPKGKGKGKGGKGKKGASSLDEWPDGQEAQPSDEESLRGGCRSLRWCCQPTREVQSTRLASLGKNPETGTKSVEILQEWKLLYQRCRR